jgi:hypothetical protein
LRTDRISVAPQSKLTSNYYSDRKDEWIRDQECRHCKGQTSYQWHIQQWQQEAQDYVKANHNVGLNIYDFAKRKVRSP